MSFYVNPSRFLPYELHAAAILSSVCLTIHTPYSRIIMCQKWEGDCGLWDLNEIIKKIYTESLKKIVGAVWELPAK